jgi:WD40 repeat protein
MALAIRYADGSASPASGAPCYLLSASGDGTARLWIDSGSAATGGEGAPPQFKLKAVLRGHERALLAAELLTAHGLAATGSDDCTIRSVRLRPSIHPAASDACGALCRARRGSRLKLYSPPSAVPSA